MVLNIATFVGAVAPVALSTFISHYFSRDQRAKKPTNDISYDEGLALIRKFLLFASQNTVEDLQHFTTQSVPLLKRVKTNIVYIPEQHLTEAAHAIQLQLQSRGIRDIGGKSWWQWRCPGTKMSAEWIETPNIYNQRKNGKQTGNKVMFYVHGGAYFFGSVDVHRYQLQRHAHKLKGRVFAPRYRLSPQYPFPCGLQDCLAAYMFLTTIQAPNTIVLAGDSAGAGMILSMMVVMRDQRIPLPSGAVLISPWVDLTHSFPSIGEEHPLDYIPSCGFHHKPSKSWPPENRGSNSDDESMVDHVALQTSEALNKTDAMQEVLEGHNSMTHIEDTLGSKDLTHNDTASTANAVPKPKRNISIMIDGKPVEINDQVHMYAPNHLLTHPLVSPVFQPSLGGLPPLLILTGDGEMLRDEQIYLAHKAANPSKYTLGEVLLDKGDLDQIHQWTPTNVQLQVWEGLCHAAPTLSFTRPAKHMYRSIAQFSTWVLARSQENFTLVLKDDRKVSVPLPDGQQLRNHLESSNLADFKPMLQIGKAGDPLPPFENHMIRQRVDCNGFVSPLAPESELAACNLDPSQIGLMKEKLILQWLDIKQKNDKKYASLMQRIQKQRAKDALKYKQLFQDGENPPPTALVGRSINIKGCTAENETTHRTSLRNLWKIKHTSVCKSNYMENDLKTEKHTENTGLSCINQPMQPKINSSSYMCEGTHDFNKPQNIKSEEIEVNQTISAAKTEVSEPFFHLQAPSNESLATNNEFKTPINPNPLIADTITDRKRPTAGGIAYPFTLKGHSATTSMLTLTSLNDVDSSTGPQGLAQ